MIKLLFKKTVSDKFTNEEYKEGKAYEFKDERGKEIASKVTNDGQPYAVIVERKEEVETATKNLKVETAVNKTTRKKTTKKEIK